MIQVLERRDDLAAPAKRYASPPRTFDDFQPPGQSEQLQHGFRRTRTARQIIFTSAHRDIAEEVAGLSAQLLETVLSGSHASAWCLTKLHTQASWGQGEHTAGIETMMPRTLIAETRILTGYAWEQLAALLGTTRRSLLNWTNGRKVRQSNQDTIRNVARLIRYIDRGRAELNSLALLATDENGNTAFELIVDGRYDQAAHLVGKGKGWEKRKNLMKELDPARVTSAQAMGLFPSSTQPAVQDEAPSVVVDERQIKGRRVLVRRK